MIKAKENVEEFFGSTENELVGAKVTTIESNKRYARCVIQLSQDGKKIFIDEQQFKTICRWLFDKEINELFDKEKTHNKNLSEKAGKIVLKFRTRTKYEFVQLFFTWTKTGVISKKEFREVLDEILLGK